MRRVKQKGKNAISLFYRSFRVICSTLIVFYHVRIIRKFCDRESSSVLVMQQQQQQQQQQQLIDQYQQLIMPREQYQHPHEYRHHRHQQTTPRTTSTRTPCPEEYRKLIWFEQSSGHKLYEPVYRAFHSRGWSVTRDVSRAHVLWSDQPGRSYDESLKPWQRYNQFPNTDLWDDKDNMALVMNDYYKQQQQQQQTKTKYNHDHDQNQALVSSKQTVRHLPPLHSFPESYVLHLPNGLKAFRKRLLKENGGLDIPWVLKNPIINQGKGVTILAPRSEALKGLVDRIQRQQEELSKTKASKEQANGGDGDTGGWEDQSADDDDDEALERMVVQKYICDEMTYGDRKFDVRVFWTVASVDPLIVLYHTQQNYVRIGHAVYDESNFSNSTKAHLTTHTFGSAETKATWDEFREYVERHVLDPGSKFRYRFNGNHNNINKGLLSTIEAIHRDPFGHVQNQMKTTIAHLVDAYKNLTFNRRSMVTENGFSWHAADMIVDNNLDVYIIEGTDGPGKDEDYDFRIKMHDEMLGSVVDIVEEVVNQQEEGRPLDVADMKANGVFGGYDVVYDDGWMFDYRYERLPHPGCGNPDRKQLKKDGGSDAMSPTLPTRKIVPATFTALTKKKHEGSNGIPKTFWMKSRTKKTCEPIARSLRRNGWTPVDHPEEARLVYLSDEEERYEPHPWQLVSRFPSQYSFFESDYLNYLDSGTMGHGEVCRPISHQGRRIRVQVYWLVLSLDPLTVLYHDGFVGVGYSRKHENEFLTLEKQDRDGKATAERVWRGSWTGFEHYINTTSTNLVYFSQQAGSSTSRSKAASAAAAIRLDPVSHVKNQMKQALVHIAEGFRSHSHSYSYIETPEGKESYSLPTTYSSFALFHAQFEVDRNLNVFFKDSYDSYTKGEDHSEIVHLHNDLYGAAFHLLEHLNATSTRIEALTNPRTKNLMGKYEWLIHAKELRTEMSNGMAKMEKSNTINDNEKEPLWKFGYDWKHKAKECFE